MRWKNARVAIFALLVTMGFLLQASTALAEVVKNTKPPFTMTVPDGFVARNDLNKGDQFLTYHRAGITGAQLGAILAVDHMGGVIRRDAPKDDPKLAAKGFTIGTGKWKSFDIWVARQPLDIAGRPAVTFIAQVPLKTEAIQVKVLIDAADEAEGRALLDTVLATVDGETNWLTDDERSAKLSAGVTRMGITIGVIVVVVIAMFAAFRKKSSPPPSYSGGSYGPPPGSASFGPPSGAAASSAPPGGSKKCANCGLVSFAGASCRRCGSA